MVIMQTSERHLMSKFFHGHSKQGVYGIKHFYWVQCICLHSDFKLKQDSPPV